MFQNKIIFLLLLLSLTMFGNCSEEKKDNTALLAALALASSSSPAAGNPASETHVSLNRIYLTTSVITGGNLGGISGADARCSSDGNKPSTGTYKAMIVSGTTRRACSTANCGGGSSENIDWVLKPSTKYYQADGTTEIFTTNASGIFVFGTATNVMSNTIYAGVWTGLSTDWTNTAGDCTAWTSTAGTTGRGSSGFNTTDDLISIEQTAACNATAYRLYCVEQ